MGRRTADHGRDFFMLELSRGGRVRIRLGGQHVGRGRYVFPGWIHVSPGDWNATFLLWATARRDLLQGASPYPSQVEVDNAAVGTAATGKRTQGMASMQPAQPHQALRGPHRLPLGFNALLHTDYLWQLQHRYVETTPLRPPVLTAQLHKHGPGRSGGNTTEGGRSSSVTAGAPQPRPSQVPVGGGMAHGGGPLAAAGFGSSKAAAGEGSAAGAKRQRRHWASSRRRRVLNAGATRSTSAANGTADETQDSSKTVNNSSDSNPAARPLCTTGAAKGEWVRLPEGARDCPPGVCTGPLSPLLYGSPDNAAMDFHDVYVPYSCQYRLYTPDEAAACLGGTRLAVVGDSRAHELHWYLSMHYPGVHGHPVVLLPYRVGIRALLAAEARHNPAAAAAVSAAGNRTGGSGEAHAGPAGSVQHQAADAATATSTSSTGTSTAAAAAAAPVTLRELMSGYDVVVLSSELHDIADYEHAAADYLEPYGLDPGPPELRVSMAAGAIRSATNTTAHNAPLANASGMPGTAEALHPGGAPAAAQCAPDTREHAQLPKWRPVAQYLDALSELVTRYDELRAELQQAGLLRVRRVLWLMPGYRPAATPACLPNQLERMLCLQQWELAQVAGRAGWEVLDLGTMAQDGPEAWWSDDVHVSGSRSGHKRTHSGVQAMQLQALFNVLCNTPRRQH
ncbi:hypothetical protein HXX76_002594 [Chlamydomonas incerta]|uniref:Uncharacterized protein n=1 Tax=Chlamydomonas incerta TaxID=51695 RepID=A0A835TCB9_CHLIN|nr:hypothetical protein HXX76_002594 [Chlamydomonas incerta]|eukprot:KAG2442508.1 hypothetical protein HXX76_002594 [Chlamydomonas incerta]